MEALDKFSQFTGTTRVQYDSDSNDVKASGSKPSNFMGRLWDWMTRSDAQVADNKVTVGKFIAQVKEAYPEVGDIATAGLASHLEKGKPLTGRRIHEVIDLAEKLKTQPPYKEKSVAVHKLNQPEVKPKPPTMEPEVRDSLGMFSAPLFRAEAMMNAKMNGLDVSNLSPGELASIYAYTTSEPRVGYNFMNPALREPDNSDLEYLRPAVKSAANGLKKLPDFTDHGGLCYRTVNAGPFLDQYQKGSTVTELGFTSTHKWEHAEENGINPEKSGGVMLIIAGQHGKDVSGLSAHRKEQEVLYGPLTKFEVTDRFENEQGGLVIKMREID